MAGFDFSTAHEDEFHAWYDLEHLPERQRVPGFGRCERWIGYHNPKHSIATYDLDSVDVLRSEPYMAIAYDNLSVWSKRVTGQCTRLLRCEGVQLNPSEERAPAGAGGLLINAMNIAPEHEADFNAWYDDEHLPALRAVDGTLAARRFRSEEGTHRYVAVYHLREPEVTLTDAWKNAAFSPWTERARAYFQDHLSILYKAYTPAT
jgi:hypothetical protein